MAKSLWQLAFERRYAQLTGSIPMMHWGNDPAADMAVFERLTPGHEYWVLYPLLNYDTDYWVVFHKLFDSDKRKLKLSTALVLSEQILGADVCELDIPDAWVLSVEIAPELESARII